MKKLLMFKTSYCTPCRFIYESVIKKLIQEKVCNVEVIDCEVNFKKAGDFNVKSTPTIVILDKNNEEEHRFVGTVTYDKLIEVLK